MFYNMFLGNTILITPILIPLALGYIVLYLARKEQGAVKMAGNIIGIFLIVVSTMVILNILLSGISRGRMRPMQQDRGMMMERGSRAPAPAAVMPKK